MAVAPLALSAVTVKANDLPAVALREAMTTKCVAPEDAVTLTGLLLPVSLALSVSVAVSVWLPAVFNVTLNVPTGVYNSFGLETVLGAIPYFGGTAMLTEISGFAQTVAATGLQLMGILIGLVVSLDLVEAIGKLLGAPSAHTRSLLGKLL